MDIINSVMKYKNKIPMNSFEGYIIKVTRDAELDIDNDVKTDIITRIEKGLKNRKKNKYDIAIPLPPYDMTHEKLMKKTS